MASLEFVDKEPSELSPEEWLQFVAALRANHETQFLSDEEAFSTIATPIDTFTTKEDMTLKIRLHLGVPTVHTKPIRGRGVCHGKAKEGTHNGTVSYESRDLLKQTSVVYIRQEGQGLVAQFRTLSQTIVGTFKCAKADGVVDGLKLWGHFSFA